MEKQHKFSLWYVLLGVWLVLLLHNMIASALMVENIPYSEFIKLVKEGKVTEIAISENDIQGRMIPSDGSSDKGALFRTVRVDPGISQLLEAAHHEHPDTEKQGDRYHPGHDRAQEIRFDPAGIGDIVLFQ